MLLSCAVPTLKSSTAKAIRMMTTVTPRVNVGSRQHDGFKPRQYRKLSCPSCSQTFMFLPAPEDQPNSAALWRGYPGISELALAFKTSSEQHCRCARGPRPATDTKRQARSRLLIKEPELNSVVCISSAYERIRRTSGLLLSVAVASPRPPPVSRALAGTCTRLLFRVHRLPSLPTRTYH